MDKVIIFIIIIVIISFLIFNFKTDEPTQERFGIVYGRTLDSIDRQLKFEKEARREPKQAQYTSKYMPNSGVNFW